MKLPTMRQIRILQALDTGKTMKHLGKGTADYGVAVELIQRGFVTAAIDYSKPGNPTVYYRTDKGTQLLEIMK